MGKMDRVPENKYAVFVATNKDFGEKHGEYDDLETAKEQAAILFVSGEYQRVSIYRGQTWLRSWVETSNASEEV